MSEKVKLLRRQFARALMRRGACHGAAIGAWAGGGCLLLIRLTNLPPTGSGRHWLLLAIVIAAAITGALLSLRRLPSANACLTLLDNGNRAGGLLMCTPLPGADQWPITAAHLPQLRWQWQRSLAILLFAACFALATALLPDHYFRRPLTPRQEGLQHLIATLQEQLETAAGDSLLPQDSLEDLTDQLAQLAENSDATDPARTLEALDHLAEELSRTAASHTDEITASQTALQAAQELIEQMLASTGAETSSSQSGDAGTDGGNQADAAPDVAFDPAVSEALKNLLASSPIAPDLLSELLAASQAPDGLTPADLQKLADLLQQAAELNQMTLEKLLELKLIEAAQCENMLVDPDAEACALALAELLEGDDAAALAAAELIALCGLPGVGAPTRGPGAAPLTWTDPSSREGVEFENLALAPGQFAPDTPTHLEGLSITAPEVPDQPLPTTPGALVAPDTALGGTATAPILPRHRETVSHFFK